MKITALTCTFQRPQAFELCKMYVARQTRQPDQWLILDGPEPMTEKVLKAFRENLITGDAVIFAEDDDWFDPKWFAWCAERLEKYDIVGQGFALYYNVAQRWWSDCWNRRHASLCQTAIRSEMFDRLCNVIEAFDNQWFDTRLWRLECRRFLDLPRENKLVIGIKGMPGMRGYSREHRKAALHEVHPDPSMAKLWQLIGQDAEAYLPHYQRK